MSALQVKLLAAILGVLLVIAGLLARGGRQAVVLTDQDRKTQRIMQDKMMPIPPQGGWFYKKQAK